MELLIGGRAQGKRNVALQRYPDAQVFDEDLTKEAFAKEQHVIWDHFHLYVKKSLDKGMEPDEIWEEVSNRLANIRNLVIISDEIGNGIVPMDALERRYREETGRILCKLAECAESVERIFCGIPQKIKG